MFKMWREKVFSHIVNTPPKKNLNNYYNDY